MIQFSIKRHILIEMVFGIIGIYGLLVGGFITWMAFSMSDLLSQTLFTLFYLLNIVMIVIFYYKRTKCCSCIVIMMSFLFIVIYWISTFTFIKGIDPIFLQQDEQNMDLFLIFLACIFYMVYLIFKGKTCIAR